uniref:LytR/CpsA/Psr regulator C-terminal domain-containing protein n=1 Tax=uncultured Nocardioidaceae bacterium TaxID=253824 RepID=A0A6J4KMG3_9ACTN|nr:MAG: hypothetical protein AVDCRST_MAG46-91 [uncultured Nocardioidaceae bacterium]
MSQVFTGRSWALLTSVAVVVAAVLAFLITGSPDSDPAVAAAPSSPSPSPSPSDEREPVKQRPEDKPDRKPAEQRREKPDKPTAYVEVFNNSGITGLAGETASSLSGAGWKVVGTDNWYGSIPASTVYYPSRLKDQASLLAEEIGATRVRPAVEPMRFDRLTLILTGDL